VKQHRLISITSITISLTLHLVLFAITLYPSTPLPLKEEGKSRSLISAHFILSSTPSVVNEEANTQSPEDTQESYAEEGAIEKVDSAAPLSSIGTVETKGTTSKKEESIEVSAAVVSKNPLITPTLPQLSNTRFSLSTSHSLEVDEVSFESVSKGIYLPSPLYPPRAVEERVEGEVIVELLIGRSGVISSITIIQSSHSSILDQACIDAIQNKWVFSPSSTIRKTTKRFVFSLQ
jgi:TonB family protein